ncbi:MAG TPA: nickel-binding protein [Thermoanaerobaculia bacterium]
MARIVVERSFPEPLEETDLELANARLGPCLVQFGARHVRSLVAPDGRRTLCEFEGPDAESVRMANRMAEVPFERVWTARVFAPAGERP